MFFSVFVFYARIINSIGTYQGFLDTGGLDTNSLFDRFFCFVLMFVGFLYLRSLTRRKTEP